MSTFKNVEITEDLYGVVDDYIIERDSNESGNWIKYKSGIIMQWGRQRCSNVNINIKTDGNTLFRSDQFKIYYPQKILNTAVPFLSTATNTGCFVTYSTGVVTTDGIGFWFSSGVQLTGRTFDVNWFVIGSYV